MYYNYHSVVKKLLKEEKLIGWYICDNYNNIKPALVLIFADYKHHYMPIREYRWNEYLEILPINKKIE